MILPHTWMETKGLVRKTLNKRGGYEGQSPQTSGSSPQPADRKRVSQDVEASEQTDGNLLLHISFINLSIIIYDNNYVSMRSESPTKPEVLATFSVKPIMGD